MARIWNTGRKKSDVSLFKDGKLQNRKKHKKSPPPPPPAPKKSTTAKKGPRCSECLRGHRYCDGARPCGRCIHVGRPHDCVDQGVPLPSAGSNSTINASGSSNTGAGNTGADNTGADNTGAANSSGS